MTTIDKKVVYTKFLVAAQAVEDAVAQVELAKAQESEALGKMYAAFGEKTLYKTPEGRQFFIAQRNKIRGKGKKGETASVELNEPRYEIRFKGEAAPRSVVNLEAE